MTKKTSRVDFRTAITAFMHPNAENREQAVACVARLILAVPDKRLERLHQVGELVRGYILRRDSRVGELRTSLLSLVRQLVEGGWVEMMLDIERYLNLGLDLSAQPAKIDPAFMQRIHQHRCKATTIDWVTLVKHAYYIYIGNAFGRSIAWALQLLAWVDDMWTLGSVTFLHAFVFREVLTAFMAPPSEFIPVKRWFDQIIRGLEDREDARQTFRDLSGVIRSFLQVTTGEPDPAKRVRQPAIAMAPLTSSPKDMEEIQRFLNLSPGELMERYEDHNLCLAHTDLPCVRGFSQIEADRMRARVGTAHEAKEWLARYGAVADQRMRDQWREICEHPARLPRPNRLDFVEINVPALHHAGVRGVILNAEEGFPDMILEIYLRERTPHLHCHRWRVSDVMASEHLPVPPAYVDRSTLTALLRLTLIDICHRIIVRDEDFPPHPGGSCFGGTANVEVIRRAHRRALLPGQSPGREALERAAKASFRLEPGYTFVKAVTKEDGTLTHGLPSRPFALYTQQDFLKRIA